MQRRTSQATVERKFWRLMQNLMLVSFGVLLLGHGLATLANQHFLAQHCEATPLLKERGRSPSVAWTCDNARTYFR